jgi:hypothetical protein
MYHIIKPDSTVLRNNVPECILDQFVKDNPDVDLDFGRLDWKPAER